MYVILYYLLKNYKYSNISYINFHDNNIDSLRKLLTILKTLYWVKLEEDIIFVG